MTEPTQVFAVADDFVEQLVRLDPGLAVALGRYDVPGATDYSPEAQEQRADLERATLDRLSRATLQTHDDEVAVAVMRERIGADLARHDAGDGLRDLNVLGAPPLQLRAMFDLLPTDPEHVEGTLQRLTSLPEALRQWRASLEVGRTRDLLAARRQALAVAEQMLTFAGRDGAAGWFEQYVGPLPASADQRDALVEAARSAQRAYVEGARYLREDYATHACERDGVGEERYAREARLWTGSNLDLAETYAWGWDELERLTRRMREVGQRLRPGTALAAIPASLDTDPQHTVDGADAVLRWLEELTRRATDELDGRYVDLDPRVRRCEVKVAPEGTAAAPYYMPPSEDLTRPGSTWLPLLGRERFPRWWLTSVWYHESVPGHHLQVATAAVQAEHLTRFQRSVCFCSGHGEGWALYAERLMDELGYFEDPGDELGFLSGQAMRAVRVIVDIGLHLDLRIPDGQAELSGERWTPELARRFLVERALTPAAMAESEVDRYLGLPGQAISYKVGERVWLECREAARARQGEDFDLRHWHGDALRLGSMGLDTLRELLAAT